MFQRFMNQMLWGLPFCYVYIDDILMASPSADEHVAHLRQLFARLVEFGLVVNVSNCKLGKLELDFLEHTVNSARIRPLHIKVQAFRNSQTKQKRSNSGSS